MKHSDFYNWEMETATGQVLKQYDENGKEQSWKTLDPDQVVRVSLVPQISVLPLHHVIIDRNAGDRFIKRFGRGFLKQTPEGFKLKEYINCVVTNHLRFWVFSNGHTMVTHKDYEVRI